MEVPEVEVTNDYEDEPIPLQDADVLYTWYAGHTSDRSVITHTEELVKLYEISHFPDKLYPSPPDITTHHHAATSPWTTTDSCCIFKGLESHGPSR
eukprot:5165092-Pyramimonas_sp.AAC.1